MGGRRRSSSRSRSRSRSSSRDRKRYEEDDLFDEVIARRSSRSPSVEAGGRRSRRTSERDSRARSPESSRKDRRRGHESPDLRRHRYGRSSRHREKRPSPARSRSRSASPISKMDKWDDVEKDPTNFDTWMALINTTEASYNDSRPDKVMSVYTRFLARYPYCYGYWRKHAELYRRDKHYQKALQVYQDGVEAISMSVDLWISYLQFLHEISQGNEGAIDQIQNVHEEAVSTAGLEFASDPLWQMIIEWEISRGDMKSAIGLLDRLLKTPTHQFNANFQKFEQLVANLEPHEYLSDEEYADVIDLVKRNLSFGVDQMCTVDPEDPGKKKHHPEVLAFIRAEVVARRKKVNEATAIMYSERFAFEQGVRRPYFHVKPLERAQLDNWKEYLEWEAQHGSHQRVRALFERCLIACALYEEFWIKYASWLQLKAGEPSAAVEVLQRAANIHCRRRPGIALATATIHEANGDWESAMACLSDFDKRCPGYAVIESRRCGLLRRKHGTDDERGLSDAVQHLEKLIHNQETPRTLASFYSMRLSRLHHRLRGDRRLALRVIKDALHKDDTNSQLLLAQIDLHLSAEPLDHKAVMEAFQAGINNKGVALAERLRFSQRRIDYLDEFGCDPAELLECTLSHQELIAAAERVPTTVRRNGQAKRGGRDAPPVMMAPSQMMMQPPPQFWQGPPMGMGFPVAPFNAPPPMFAVPPQPMYYPQ